MFIFENLSSFLKYFEIFEIVLNIFQKILKKYFQEAKMSSNKGGAGAGGGGPMRPGSSHQSSRSHPYQSGNDLEPAFKLLVLKFTTYSAIYILGLKWNNRFSEIFGLLKCSIFIKFPPKTWVKVTIRTITKVLCRQEHQVPWPGKDRAGYIWRSVEGKVFEDGAHCGAEKGSNGEWARGISHHRHGVLILLCPIFSTEIFNSRSLK